MSVSLRGATFRPLISSTEHHITLEHPTGGYIILSEGSKFRPAVQEMIAFNPEVKFQEIETPRGHEVYWGSYIKPDDDVD